MLTTLQKQKFHTYFQHLDRDGSGTLRWKDFEAVIENIRAAQGWEAEEKRYLSLIEAQRYYWRKLVERAGADGDGGISSAGFEAFHESLAREIDTHGKPPVWAVALVHACHRALDTGGDGAVDQGEYTTYLKALGARVDPAAAFRRLDLDGDGKIGIDEMEELYTQFIISDDPADPGNYLVTGSLEEGAAGRS